MTAMEQKATYVESDCRNWKRDKINSTLDARTAELDGSGSHASRVAKKNRTAHTYSDSNPVHILFVRRFYFPLGILFKIIAFGVWLCARARAWVRFCTHRVSASYKRWSFIRPDP